MLMVLLQREDRLFVSVKRAVVVPLHVQGLHGNHMRASLGSSVGFQRKKELLSL